MTKTKILKNNKLEHNTQLAYLKNLMHRQTFGQNLQANQSKQLKTKQQRKNIYSTTVIQSVKTQPDRPQMRRQHQQFNSNNNDNENQNENGINQSVQQSAASHPSQSFGYSHSDIQPLPSAPSPSQISPKKQSHQVKALLYKTASLQWKQPCTNICQVMTPIICLIFTILIRNVAVDNLPTNQDSVYSKVPLILFKFNDYQLLNKYKNIIFDFDCSQWYLYDWADGVDPQFLGERVNAESYRQFGQALTQTEESESFFFNNPNINITQAKSPGMLTFLPKTNERVCYVNDSFYPPYQSNKKQTIPFFLNPKISIDEQIYQRYLYFNTLDQDTIKHSSAIDKMPDGGVYFNKADMEGLQVNLKINDLRMFQLHKANGVTRIRLRNPISNQSSYKSYINIAEGMLSLQDMITQAYFKKVLWQKEKENAAIVNVESKSEFQSLKSTTTAGSLFPVSGFLYMPLMGDSSAFIQAIINIVATIIFPLSLSLLLPVFLYGLVLEKQSKTVQMMRMNGLSMATYWGVNFVFSFSISLATYMVFWLFGRLVLANALFVQTGADVLALVLVGWALCQIGLSWLLQVFISSSRAANIIGYLVSIWTNLIGATLSVALYQYPVIMPLAIKLWPTIAFNRLFYLMFINCSADHCISSVGQLTDEMWSCIRILYASAVILALAGMYLFEVVPQEFGVQKGLGFPFSLLRKRLLGKKSEKNFDIKKIDSVEFVSNQEGQDPGDPFSEGKFSSDQQQCDKLALAENRKVSSNKFQDYALICNKLTKVYEQNNKKATNQFSLILEDNKIFGLLGPNGAGKTTLLSMITGVFSPSSGQGFVSGHSIIDEIDEVHMNMGVCPQFDILWDELTVEEHLYFYARLRGTPGRLEAQKVAETMQEVALKEFADFRVKQLSGGMKRRLSVAISMVGDPRIVFLDQPTTGLDPQNRRNLWELLSRCKSKRSLFLTTHLMEQAESLCDRIGIITGGRLRTVGDQVQLKKLYGNGYTLTINVECERDRGQGYYDKYADEDEDELSLQNIFSNSKIRKNNQSSQYASQLDYSIANRANQSILSSVSHNFQDVDEQNRDDMMNDTIQPQQSHPKKKQQRKYTRNSIHNQDLQIIKEKIINAIPSARLQKQLNGTLKFALGQIKISQVLTDLEALTRDQQQTSVPFQWAINNSSLEDVFLNVVNNYPKGKNKKKQQ